MLRFTCKRIPFSILLLTALLSGFCAGSILESTEGEASESEIEEVILGRCQGERLTKLSRSYVTTRLCHRFCFCSLQLPEYQCSENSARNGFGAPLTL